MGAGKVIRVVLDTNVVVSALLFGGNPARFREMWREGRIIPLISREILDEYLRVLAYPRFRLTREEILYLLHEEILSWFEVVEVRPEGRYVQDDPEDDKFIHCALSGKADFLVSGDRHLLELPNPPVCIVSVKEFLTRTGP